MKHVTEHEELILNAARNILQEIANRCNGAEHDAADDRYELRRLVVACTIAGRAGDALSSAIIGLNVYLSDDTATVPDSVQA